MGSFNIRKYWDEMNKKTVFKTLCCVDVIFVLFAYIIVLTSKQAQGYELDIYAMYSPIFWFIVLSTITVSITIIVLLEYWKIQNYWMIPLIIMIILYSIILLFPLSRGYYMFALGSCDVFAHLSWAQYILNTGSIDTYYPIAHILLTEFQLAGISLDTAALFIPGFFSVLYILYLSILGRTLQKGSWISLLPLIFALPLMYTMFHYSFHPYVYALFFIPLYFYLVLGFIKYPKLQRYKILLLILSFLIVFFHPLIVLIIILFLIGAIVVNLIFNYPVSNKCNWNAYLIQIIGILAICFGFWYLSFSSILSSLSTVINALFSQTGSSSTIFEYQTELVVNSGASPLYIIKLFILNYGPIFSYLLVGLICLLFTFNSVRVDEVSKIEIILAFQYILSILIAFTFLVGNFIIFEPVRSAGPAILMSTIYIPVVIGRLVSQISLEKTKKIIYSALVIFGIVVTTLSIFNVFPSPIISQSSWHMTFMEKEGLDWFMEYRDDDLPLLIMENTVSFRKYGDYYNEKHHNLKNKIISQRISLSNLKYETNTTLAKTLDSGKFYFISTEMYRQNYLAAPEERRSQLKLVFTSEDTERFKKDSFVNFLYSNSEFESWSIQGIK